MTDSNDKLFERAKMTEDFTPLFYPKTVAIIGASENKVGGSKYYFALKDSGYLAAGGKVFFINPKIKELFGLPVYPHLNDLPVPKPIDLVIISVPAKFVPGVIRQMNKENARFGVIFSSGFGESDNPDLDKELNAAIFGSTTRFIGPNCLGVVNPTGKMAIYPDWHMAAGPISYIAQSGGTMVRLCHFLTSWEIGFRHVLSIGNMADIQASELFPHYLKDSGTKVVALYLESIKNGNAFLTEVKKLSLQKPVVLWKGGQSQRGMKATMSHTGGLAGSFQVWKGMAQQYGVMVATYFEMFLDLVQVVTLRPIYPENLNVAIVVAGGGIGVEFTDLFENNGFKVPDLLPKTQQALGQIFPPINTNFKNPVDLGEYGYDPRLFAKAMEIILQDEQIGSVIFVREPDRFPVIAKVINVQDPQKQTIETLKTVVKNVKKPIFCNPSPNKDSIDAYQLRMDFQKAMFQANLPVINYIAHLPAILYQLYLYGKFLKANKP